MQRVDLLDLTRLASCQAEQRDTADNQHDGREYEPSGLHPRVRQGGCGGSASHGLCAVHLYLLTS